MNANKNTTLTETQNNWLAENGFTAEPLAHGGLRFSRPGKAVGDDHATWTVFEERRGQGYVVSLVSEHGAYRPCVALPLRKALRAVLNFA